MNLEGILSDYELTGAQKKIVGILYASGEPLTPRQIRDKAKFGSRKTVYTNLKSLIDLGLVCFAEYAESDFGHLTKVYRLCEAFVSAVEEKARHR